MNRKLIAAIVVIIAVCIGIYFWTEWEKARFDASLPKPPAEEEQVADDVTEDTAGGHWHGDEWHAEPHPAPKPAKPPRPFEVFVTAEEMPRTSTGEGPAEPKRRTLWNSIDVDFPPEGAPRPLKHLSALELYNATVRPPPHLSDEEVTQAQYELFFRRPKEERDERRQQRARDRATRDFQKAFDEQLRAYDKKRRARGSAD